MRRRQDQITHSRSASFYELFMEAFLSVASTAAFAGRLAELGAIGVGRPRTARSLSRHDVGTSVATR
jgi:hypothetical protein